MTLTSLLLALKLPPHTSTQAILDEDQAFQVLGDFIEFFDLCSIMPFTTNVRCFSIIYVLIILSLYPQHSSEILTT